MPARILQGNFGAWAVQPDGRIELRVRLHDDAGVEPVVARLHNAGIEVVRKMAIFPGVVVRADETQIPMIAGWDDVIWISEGLPARAAENDLARSRTRVNEIQAPPYSLAGTGLHVGMHDAGTMDVDHADFGGRATRIDPSGVSEHATHVAGTLAGSGLRSEAEGGTALQWRGMATEAMIYSWDFAGDVIAETADGVQNYGLIADNNSWGVTVDGSSCELYGNYDLLAPEYDALVDGAAGRPISIVFSAGNERDDGDCPLIDGGYGCLNPPKAAKNIIVVGATQSDTDSMTSFSSWGPCDDGRLKPDLTAPGCREGPPQATISTFPGDTYGDVCGTSAAAPVVTGILTLLYQLYQQQTGGLVPSPSLLRGILAATAQDLGNPGPDYAFGHGRVDAKRAADLILDDTPLEFTIRDSTAQDIPFFVAPETPSLHFILAWDDPDASPLAAPALVNNLDLLLLDPGGGEHYPWVLDPAQPSLDAGTGIDSLNNIENVQVTDPLPGLWTARISATNAPEGPQIVSLIGLDLNPPDPPALLVAADPTETTMDVIWQVASTPDRIGSLVVRSTSPITWSPVEGTVYESGESVQPRVKVIFAGVEALTVSVLTDSLLDPETTYYYAAHSYDDFLNYSDAITATNSTAPCDPGPCRTPNYGGFLIVHSNPDLIYTTDNDGYCGQSGLTSCADAITSQMGPSIKIIHVLAAFPSESSPRVTGLTFGIDYDSTKISLEDYGSCGDFELPTTGWPAPGEGTAVTFAAAQTGLLTEVYWFAAYNLAPATLNLIPHPTQGGYFADDHVPANLEPIACYGAFGFDTSGSTCCAITDVDIGGFDAVSTRLNGSFPNPFTGWTQVSFTLAAEARVRLTVYDVSGRKVRDLIDEPCPAGTQAVAWNGRNDAGLEAPGGLYFVKMRQGSQTFVSRLVLVR
jgi:hypothetical protein